MDDDRRPDADLRWMKATIQRENESMLTFAATEMEVLEDLLKRAKARAEGGS